MDRRHGKEGANSSGSQGPTFSFPEDQTSAQKSIPERIGASARGLLRIAVLEPPPGTTVETLASTASSTEKGHSSSSSAYSVSSSEVFRSRPTSSSSTESFRSQENDLLCNHLASTPEVRDFEAFVGGARSSTSGPIGELFNQDTESPIVGQGSISHLEESHRILSHTLQGMPDHAIFLDDDKALDGAGVVALLSDPTFCLEDTQLEGIRDPEFFRQELREAARPRPMNHWEIIANDLQLIPNYGNTPAALKEMATAMPHIDEYAQDVDVQPWLQILNSYHDEVWGDMLPLVKQAREELEPDDNDGQSLQDKPAVRRLQMLIGHLKH